MTQTPASGLHHLYWARAAVKSQLHYSLQQLVLQEAKAEGREPAPTV